MKKVYLALSLLVIAAGGAFHFRDAGRQWLATLIDPQENEPVPLMRVTPQNYRVLVRADGELTGLQITPVHAPMVKTGSLKVAWLADEGQIVEKGDTVVAFDQTDAVLTLQRSHNTLDTQNHLIEKQKMEARSRAETLMRDLESTDLELDYTQDQIRKDERIFSRWEIQESIMSAALARYRKGHLNRKGEVEQGLSEADLRLLQVDRKLAETEMEMARETLSSLESKAPLGGVVLYRRTWTVLEVGSEVWPTQPLMDIADMERFRARLFVPENQIRGVQTGKKVQVRLDAFPGENFSGEIDKVDKIARQRHPRDPRKFFLCEARLHVSPESMEKLNPGMRFSAEIELGEKTGVIVIPRSAVIKKDSEFVVFVRENGEYLEKKIEIVDSDFGFHVVQGVSAGTSICLHHPLEDQRLHLPDFSSPTASTQRRRYVPF
ncbi:MAG: efflux RND transporter periplasmic adaptor subunit [Candidatus Aminicenantes bacterium]|nr:efflux RND transporter periplasmic adaptor subunit [Candidatus Aminicenantes bacterium]